MLCPIVVIDDAGSAPPLTQAGADTVALTEQLRTLAVATRRQETIALVEELTRELLSSPGLPVTETWTVPNVSGTLDGDHNWDDYIGTQQWGVVGNRARLVGSGPAANQGGRLAVGLGIHDYTVSAIIRQWSVPSGTTWFGVLARMQGNTALTFYEALLLQTGTATSLILYRFVAGVQTLIGGPVIIATPVDGTQLALRVLGDQLTVIVDGVALIEVTDPLPAGINTGQFAGLIGGADLGNQIEVDDINVNRAVLIGTAGETVGLTEALTPELVSTPNVPLAEGVGLGEVLTPAGPTVPTLPITETWTVPDAPGVLDGDHPWHTFIGANEWGVVGAKARLAGTASAHNEGGRMRVALGRADYTIGITISAWLVAGGTMYFGLLGRMQGDTSLTFYEALILSSGGAHSLHLFKFVAGAQTAIGAPVAIAAPGEGTTLALRLNGSQLTVILDGVPRITETDTDIPTGQFVGILGGTDSGNQIDVDMLQVTGLTLGAQQAETLGLSEQAMRVMSRTLGESALFVEQLATRIVSTHEESEGVILTEAQRRELGRAVRETLDITESKRIALARTVTETLGLAESLARVLNPASGADLGIVYFVDEAFRIPGHPRER